MTPPPPPPPYLKSLKCIVNCTRDSMEQIENNFENEFSSNCQESSVPIELLSLISTLIDGVNIENEIFSQPALASAQQIMFNYRINKEKKVNNIRRHLKIKEIPLAIYITLKLYTITRSKTLIQCFHSLGICISYGRLLDITKDLSERLLSQYARDGVLLPSVLKQDIFTIIAKDNIGINAKSSTASKHFHGTSMSILQFPLTENPTPLPPIEIDPSNFQSSKSKKVNGLPESYANVKAISDIPVVPFKSPLFMSVCTVNMPTPNTNMTDNVMLDALDYEIC